MADVRIFPPDDLMKWADEQVQAGRFSNVSEYVCDLMQRDRQQIVKLARLQDLVTEGLESGVSTRSKAELLDTALQHITAKS